MINTKAQELLANDKSDTFLLKGLDKLIDQSDLENCESFECKTVDNFDSGEPIRCINYVNTLYPVAQEIVEPNKVKSEHLYSASANEIDEKKPDKVLQERGFGSLPSSTEAKMRDHVKSSSTTVEADSNPIRRIGSPQDIVSTPQNRRFMFESRQTTIPFLSHLNDYYYEEKKGSYGPSLDPLYGDYIELNDLNLPLELRRDQVDDLMPTIEEVLEDMDACHDEGMGDDLAAKKSTTLVKYLQSRNIEVLES
ncbi:hypothetical protein Tco_0540345 [Tanacetum coccineum]